MVFPLLPSARLDQVPSFLVVPRWAQEARDTQHLVMAALSTFSEQGWGLWSHPRSFKRHTLCTLPWKTQAHRLCSPGYRELQTRPQKASSPQRWRWRDSIFAVFPGRAVAMYFEDFSELWQDLFWRQKEHSLPDGWGEYRMDEKFQWCAEKTRRWSDYSPNGYVPTVYLKVSRWESTDLLWGEGTWQGQGSGKRGCE